MQNESQQENARPLKANKKPRLELKPRLHIVKNSTIKNWYSLVGKTSLELHLCADKLTKLQLHDGKNCCHNTKTGAHLRFCSASMCG